MKVAIGGAGAVGRSIARELVENGHDVTLIERNADAHRRRRHPGRALAARATPANSACSSRCTSRNSTW